MQENEPAIKYQRLMVSQNTKLKTVKITYQFLMKRETQPKLIKRCFSTFQCLMLYFSISLYIRQMDIFNSAKRAKDDSLKKPLNYPDPQITEKKLKEDNMRELDQLQAYLRNLYIKFDFKINKCKYSCIANAKSYREVASCQQNCSQGVSKFSQYINSRLGEMQQLLGDCVANANTLHNTMDQIYYCYQIYNLGFKKLKEFITEESMYYE